MIAWHRRWRFWIARTFRLIETGRTFQPGRVFSLLHRTSGNWFIPNNEWDKWILVGFEPSGLRHDHWHQFGQRLSAAESVHYGLIRIHQIRSFDITTTFDFIISKYIFWTLEIWVCHIIWITIGHLGDIFCISYWNFIASCVNDICHCLQGNNVSNLCE